ncbi:hypothetical protein QO002_000139 [Pararhizobium capsulatum DSM 1112]|uniref:Lectin-like protein BA14k n=1 Tax=Pararhizobium capsulatum DSM 1112 TaxID=1121113 RepID=A0ABU0BIB7_9HYPH|nr:BA14K family protein [Pararhizobium capsulatum]MDQ0318001.1 hypothetical protein [Pararhizobium capsulatum DSM 1112]
MKSAFLLLSGTAFAALSFLSVTYAASTFIDDDEPHAFRHIGEPLWKSEPTYLDRGNMTLSQVEARFGRNPTSPADAVVADASADTGGATQISTIIATAANPAHTDWCMARYRSYQPSDNTYQPYGSPRRTCESPYGGASAGVEAVEAPEAITYQVEAQEAAELDANTWCRLQYRS